MTKTEEKSERSTLSSLKIGMDLDMGLHTKTSRNIKKLKMALAQIRFPSELTLNLDFVKQYSTLVWTETSYSTNLRNY